MQIMVQWTLKGTAYVIVVTTNFAGAMQAALSICWGGGIIKGKVPICDGSGQRETSFHMHAIAQ